MPLDALESGEPIDLPAVPLREATSGSISLIARFTPDDAALGGGPPPSVAGSVTSRCSSVAPSTQTSPKGKGAMPPAESSSGGAELPAAATSEDKYHFGDYTKGAVKQTKGAVLSSAAATKGAVLGAAEATSAATTAATDAAKGAVLSYTGKETYHLGDISKATVSKATSAMATAGAAVTSKASAAVAGAAKIADSAPSSERLRQRGSLEIALRGASGLRPADANGLADPYVMIKMGGSKYWKSSAVKRKTLSPVWDETLHMEGILGDFVSGAPMQLKVLDKDVLTPDFLGRLEVSLSPLKEESAIEFEAVALVEAEDKPPVGVTGTISFTVTWTPKA